MKFIVQTVTIGKRQANYSLATFPTLEIALTYAESHPRSLVFRIGQVVRILDNKLLLRANDYMPCNCAVSGI